MKVFYVTDVFPALSQTFVSREIAVLEGLGVEVGVLSLFRPPADAPEHAMNGRLRARPLYAADLDRGKRAKALGHLYRLLTRPTAYLRAWQGSRAPGFPSMKYLFAVLPLYCRELERFGAQHLHAHFGWEGLLTAWLAGQMLNLPFSVTLHGSDVLVQPYAGLGTALRAAARVICVSEHIRQKVVTEYGVDPRRAVLIHCGIDPQLFCPAAPPPGPLRLLTVARMNPVKGLGDLIAACALLRDRGLAFRLSLVGDGAERPELEEQVRALGLEEQIALLGALPNEQLPRLYQEHSLFVLPSHSEGMGVVLMEALASGLPVVASRVGGIPEVVEDGVDGLLVAPRQPQQLAEAILALQDAPRQQRARMASAGREKILARFNCQVEGEKLRQVFAHIVQEVAP